MKKFILSFAACISIMSGVSAMADETAPSKSVPTELIRKIEILRTIQEEYSIDIFANRENSILAELEKKCAAEYKGKVVSKHMDMCVGVDERGRARQDMFALAACEYFVSSKSVAQ